MRYIFLKNRSEKNKLKSKKQRNVCVGRLRKSKMNYYSSLNEENVCNHKRFWNVVKPFLSNKTIQMKKIALIEIMNEYKKTAKVFNTSFTNIMKTVEIPNYSRDKRFYRDISDPVLKPIIKYQKHLSIVKIKQKVSSKLSFTFHHAS